VRAKKMIWRLTRDVFPSNVEGAKTELDKDLAANRKLEREARLSERITSERVNKSSLSREQHSPISARRKEKERRSRSLPSSEMSPERRIQFNLAITSSSRRRRAKLAPPVIKTCLGLAEDLGGKFTAPE